MNRGAIILSGGASTRMGRDKATLPFGSGEALLQRVVRLVAEVVPLDRIVCVAAADQLLPLLPAGVRVEFDAHPHAGPLAGVAAGLAALEGRARAAFACGCDMPLLVPALVTRLFDMLGNHEIVVPHDGERVHPLAAVYRVDILPIAAALLSAGERSLTSLVDRCDSLRVSTDALRDVDPELASLRGCNTPEEYRLLLDRIHAEG